MNQFELQGYSTTGAYPLQSKTNVGQFALVVAAGTNPNGTATVTGAQASSQAATAQGLGGATGQVLGSEATSAAGSVSAFIRVDGTAAISGAQADSSAGTVSAVASGAATAAVSGAQASTSSGAVLAAGQANIATSGAQVTTSTGSPGAIASATVSPAGTQAAASAGTVIALGTGSGVGAVTGAQASTATGQPAASGQANITPAGTQVTSSTGVVGVTLSATVSLAGAEARAAAGQVTANDGSAKPGIRVVDYAPRFVTKKDAKARVLPVEALAAAGRVEAFGQRNVVARVACAHSRLVRGRVRGRGVQNPSDEDIALLLAL